MMRRMRRNRIKVPIALSVEQLSSSTVNAGIYWASQTREQTVQALPVVTAKVCHSPILSAG